MKAVVMAGGEGTRLRPMTANQPKPLLPVVNKPIMEHVLRLLKRHGFDETVVTVQFLAALVRNYFGDGEEFGMSLQYATEEMPLGTAGSVRNAEDALRDEPFLVISGDALTDMDLTGLVRFHKDKGGEELDGHHGLVEAVPLEQPQHVLHDRAVDHGEQRLRLVRGHRPQAGPLAPCHDDGLQWLRGSFPVSAIMCTPSRAESRTRLVTQRTRRVIYQASHLYEIQHRGPPVQGGSPGRESPA